MKPINVLSLIIWFVLAGLLGFFYSEWAVANGFHVPVSPLSLAISVFVVAVILGFLALPIYRYKNALRKIREAKTTTLQKPIPVDPFYAVRVLLLAKASALTSAIFIGWHAGVILNLLSAPVLAGDALRPNLLTLGVSVVLLIMAFIVQSICKLPNDAGPQDPQVPA
ncbi:MAG: DUF3180 domain-containing protein [Actinobacteria bacterium]|nr:DUF3180 domain-containing protein [Actinomycetota bacterium]NBY44017.1 DUF3180 domain-containing protein [Micrococcales bacterium]NDE88712.1 DUF3180 domain-containing protein [Micrococcales bacterium]